MSNTPETDVAEYYILGEGNFVRSDICRKLERERNEAREQLRLANIDCFAALTELDEAREQRDLLVRALDECMVVNNLGVFNLGDDAKAALQKICCFQQEVGAYYANIKGEAQPPAK